MMCSEDLGADFTVPIWLAFIDYILLRIIFNPALNQTCGVNVRIRPLMKGACIG